MIKIENYRAAEGTGSLLGSFTLLYEPLGMKIRACKHFSKSGKCWIQLPSEVKLINDAKSYIPYVSFTSNEMKRKFEAEVLIALELMDQKPQAKNDDAYLPF